MNKNESKYFSTAEKMDSALMEILKTKSFEYITVSEICKKAGVNRSTFYLHYENTRDLLEETIRNMMDNFVSYFVPDGKISPINFEESQKDKLVFISEEYLMPYLSYFKENRKIFLTVFENGKLFGFEETYEKLFNNIFDPILDVFKYPESERKYVMAFYLNGINSIMIEWIKEDCTKSEKEVVKIINDCIFGLNNH
ncbi:MAG: TetR/AcrR family transcriptional regulator [Oscillospiraceae bacterium]|nr:TetR/AcrR family transcriptional regulator [Oscillospiraceae bacterium]